MTQRDIAKDKEFLSQWPETLELTAIPLYWISQYEAAFHLLEYDKNAMQEQDAAIERLQARISELEALLHPNNRPDVISRPSHDRALETIFGEWDWLK